MSLPSTHHQYLLNYVYCYRLLMRAIHPTCHRATIVHDLQFPQLLIEICVKSNCHIACQLWWRQVILSLTQIIYVLIEHLLRNVLLFTFKALFT